MKEVRRFGIAFRHRKKNIFVYEDHDCTIYFVNHEYKDIKLKTLLLVMLQ